MLSLPENAATRGARQRAVRQYQPGSVILSVHRQHLDPVNAGGSAVPINLRHLRACCQGAGVPGDKCGRGKAQLLEEAFVIVSKHQRLCFFMHQLEL